jgi:shikimate kinase
MREEIFVINSETQEKRNIATPPRYRNKANICLVGLMGSGKTTVGELLAKNLGFGFFDLDRWIEKSERLPIADIFESKGEDYFRGIETGAIAGFENIRNHVISVGGGAIVEDENWNRLHRIATVIWIKTPPIEIARRIVMSPDEIRRRPILADLVKIEDRIERQKLIQDRLSVVETQRSRLYARADLIVEHAYATPDTCAYFVADQLLRQSDVIH